MRVTNSIFSFSTENKQELGALLHLPLIFTDMNSTWLFRRHHAAGTTQCVWTLGTASLHTTILAIHELSGDDFASMNRVIFLGKQSTQSLDCIGFGIGIGMKFEFAQYLFQRHVL